MTRDKEWPGILKVLWLEKHDIHGNVVQRQENLKNILHYEGEEFLLRTAFTGTDIPDEYFLGLDNRQNLTAEDTLDDLIGEPFGGGYERQSINSTGDFGISFVQNHYRAISPIVAFRSISTSWGPCGVLFIATTLNNSGKILSSVALDSPIALDPGESVTLRLAMMLRDC